MKGEASWVTDNIESFERFCEQAGDLMWRRSAGEYNNWALDIPALMNTLTSRIGMHMLERSQHIGDAQQTMMPELMSTLTQSERADDELSDELQHMFEQSYKRRLDRDHVAGAPASLDPYRPLTDGRDLSVERAIEVSGRPDDRVLPTQNTPDDPDMQV